MPIWFVHSIVIHVTISSLIKSIDLWFSFAGVAVFNEKTKKKKKNDIAHLPVTNVFGKRMRLSWEDGRQEERKKSEILPVTNKKTTFFFICI